MGKIRAFRPQEEGFPMGSLADKMAGLQENIGITGWLSKPPETKTRLQGCHNAAVIKR